MCSCLRHKDHKALAPPSAEDLISSSGVLASPYRISKSQRRRSDLSLDFFVS